MGKLIDADALIKALGITDMNCERCAWYSGMEWSPCKRGSDFEQACYEIEYAPEAAIRCKDCKYCKTYDDIPWCDRSTGVFRVEEESFCSFGKRRADETG